MRSISRLASARAFCSTAVSRLASCSAIAALAACWAAAEAPSSSLLTRSSACCVQFVSTRSEANQSSRGTDLYTWRARSVESLSALAVSSRRYSSWPRYSTVPRSVSTSARGGTVRRAYSTLMPRMLCCSDTARITVNERGVTSPRVRHSTMSGAEEMRSRNVMSVSGRMSDATTLSPSICMSSSPPLRISSCPFRKPMYAVNHSSPSPVAPIPSSCMRNTSLERNTSPSSCTMPGTSAPCA
eukprot:scaffold4126_cov383-Prasinococcus_capsulatus_cf.AAC.2